jgi:hypothetical protein
MESAITREKQIKEGSRKKKLDLIEAINPGEEIFIMIYFNGFRRRKLLPKTGISFLYCSHKKSLLLIS